MASRPAKPLLYASLATLLLGNVLVSLAPGTEPAARYGRPVVVALACVLVLQGRAWARWLLLLMSLGLILAGPIALANGLRPWRLAGLLFWLGSVIAVAAMVIVFRWFRNRATTIGAAPDTAGAAGA